MENLVTNSSVTDLNQNKETSSGISDVLLRGLDQVLDEDHFRQTCADQSYTSVLKLIDRPVSRSSSGETDAHAYLGAVRGQEYSFEDAGKNAKNLTEVGYGGNWREHSCRLDKQDEKEGFRRGKQTRKEVQDSVEQTVVEQDNVDCQEDDEIYPTTVSDESCSNVSLGGKGPSRTLGSESGLNGDTGVFRGLKSVHSAGSEPLGVLMEQLKALPKLELHAHLNGCVRSSTLLDLYLEQGCKGKVLNSDLESLIREEDRSLTECFRLFPVIHALTTDHAVVTRITKEAIEDFILDNVVYLELRTTPKSNDVYGMSKRSYVEAVLAGFEAAGVSCNSKTDARGGQSKHRMQVRLLLSIDRRESTEAAMETVQLALEMRDRGVVGVDLSGDPAIGNWETFLPALTRAKQLGVPLTLHCGEVSNPEEIRAMLALQPSRLGHVCCLEEPEWRALLESCIPVEVCLTSNVRTESVSSMNDHHFGALYNAKHPVVLCTDDPGLFSTSLSLEYAIASTCFGLTEMELLCMAKSAINYIFADDITKLALHGIFVDALRNLKDVFTSSPQH